MKDLLPHDFEREDVHHHPDEMLIYSYHRFTEGRGADSKIFALSRGLGLLPNTTSTVTS
jgi:hypothetical protein